MVFFLGCMALPKSLEVVQAVCQVQSYQCSTLVDLGGAERVLLVFKALLAG